MLRRSGVSIRTFALSVDIVNTGYCVSVHFRKHSVIWGGKGTINLILHEINGCGPVLTMPCGRNVSLWVGGSDVKANFVPKIDIVGLVLVALLGGREPLFLKII
jgi:hypothetical protein